MTERDTGSKGKDDSRTHPLAVAFTVIAVSFVVLVLISLGSNRSWAAADGLQMFKSSLAETLELSDEVSQARIDEGPETVSVIVPADVAVAAGTVKPESVRDSQGAVVAKEDLGSVSVVLEAQYPDGYAGSLVDRLTSAGVDVDVAHAYEPSWLERNGPSILVMSAVGVLLMAVLRVNARRQPLSTARALPTRDALVENVPTTRFKDVFGADEAVEDLAEVVSFLKNPAKFRFLGASAPRGVLLSGPPGCGKTMLARAVAGEAGAAFYAVAGSEFVEMYVGVGARRVRDLFAKAREGGPAIVFIDEIDAVGRARSDSKGHTNEEREATLNQLLVELDGFAASNVVVIAATNRTDVLDEALRRAGRFDREVAVARPDRRGREALLRHYLSKVLLEDGIDVPELAKMLSGRTSGLVGADFAVLTNEAALSAARADRMSVSRDDIEAAVERAQIGKARTSAIVSDRVRTITAWHEAGHAVCALLTPGAPRPTRVSIVPRGEAGGVTWLDHGDDALKTRSELAAQLVVAFGGRAGESLILGDDITQGASGDIASATALAESMVCEWGMSAVGQMFVRREVLMGSSGAGVQMAIQQLCEGASVEAAACVRQHRPLVEALVEALLAEDTIDEVVIDRLAAEHAAAASSAA